MAELADALDLGSSVFDVGVQVPLSAPNQMYTQINICGSGSVVERCLAKADIAGSNPVSRSIASTYVEAFFMTDSNLASNAGSAFSSIFRSIASD